MALLFPVPSLPWTFCVVRLHGHIGRESNAAGKNKHQFLHAQQCCHPPSLSALAPEQNSSSPCANKRQPRVLVKSRLAVAYPHPARHEFRHCSKDPLAPPFIFFFSSRTSKRGWGLNKSQTYRLVLGARSNKLAGIGHAVCPTLTILQGGRKRTLSVTLPPLLLCF